MFFQTQIAVLDTTGKLAQAAVPATPTSCWLCGGAGSFEPSRNERTRSTCTVCDGDGLVLDVAWDHVSPDVREAYDALWRCEAEA